jgi:hypothetical protein
MVLEQQSNLLTAGSGPEKDGVPHAGSSKAVTAEPHSFSWAQMQKRPRMRLLLCLRWIALLK